MDTTDIATPRSTGGMRSEDSPTPGVFAPPESMRPTLVGDRYMISAGHPLVAQVCARVLEAGGTAIDAGVAGGLASNVIQADMCNLGGVAPIVLRRAGEDRAWAISGVGTWSRTVTLDRFRDRFGDDMPLGLGVGVVPAALDAWVTTLARFGTWRFGDVAADAIAYAEDGFRLDHRTAAALGILGRTFAAYEHTPAVYWPDGRPPREGDRLRQAALANTLRRLVAAESGSDRDAGLDAVRRAFYQGDIARRIAAWSAEHGGWLTADDLAGFACTVEPAPSVTYRGHRVFTNPAYSQGPILLLALRLLERLDLSAHAFGSADALHLILESLKLAFAERERAMADPAFTPVPLDDLLGDTNTAWLAALVDPKAALPDPIGGDTPGRARSDTTYLCVIDADGNAISAMPSDTIDGSPLIPDLGIIVSPRGVQSSNRPGHPNALAPGKRPRLTPSPALALGPADPGEEPRVLAFGCPGGDVIVQSMLQSFLNVVDFGMSLQQAVEAPRVATFSFPGSFFPNPHFPGRVDIEARVPEAVRDDLAARGHRLSDWPDWEFDAGSVQMVGDLADPAVGGRVLGAAADPRRCAYAWGR